MKEATSSISGIVSGPATPRQEAPSLVSEWAKEKLLIVLQGTVDWVTVILSYLTAYWVYTVPLERVSPQPLGSFFVFSVGSAFLYLLLMERQGLYNRESSPLNVKELRGIVRAGLSAAAFVFAATFYFKVTNISRLTLTAALTLTPVALYIQRQFFYRVHLILHRKGDLGRKVLIYGVSDVGTQLAKRLFESPMLGYVPVGFLDDDQARWTEVIRWGEFGSKTALKVLGGEDVLKQARKMGVDQVFVALPADSFERNQRLVRMCAAEGLKYAIVPNSYENQVQSLELQEIGGIPLLQQRHAHISLYYLSVKRVMDFVASVALMLIFSPFFLVFAFLIKWDTQGPIIFKQKRVGLRGREFSFYKFRTMYIEADKYARSPLDSSDSRLTRVGKKLRRTSLDELPQLFNVFRGDMSLVGPRPEMPFIASEYSPFEKLRLEAKPGITGLWQISAVRGEPIHKNLDYDLFYIYNRSLLLDLAIMLKTAISVIRGIGAF